MLKDYYGNAVGYLRCSTNMQDGSIDQQRAVIIHKAKMNKLRIVRWYVDEGKSGTTDDKRPGFMKLIDDVEKGADFKYILVYDESRWGRFIKLRTSNYWKEHCSRYGVEVIIINSQSKNGNDIGSYVIEAVEVAQASEYSTTLSRSTLRGQKSNASNGYSNGGTAPYGYKRVAVNKYNSDQVRDLLPGQHASEDEKVIFALGSPEEVGIVKRIFQLRLEGLGYRAIANTLNQENVPCPKRGRWRNKNQRWSFNTINSILSNPTYTGTMVFNRHPQSHLSGPSKEVWRNDEKDWVVKENAHPAIITKEIFAMANKSRKDYTRINRNFYDSPYLLSGLLICKKCGFNYQGQTRRVKLIKKDKKEVIVIVHYYLDGGYAGKGTSVCSPNLLRKNEVEDVIVKHIVESINQDNFIDKVIKVIESKLRESNNQESQINEMQKKIEKHNKALKNLVQLVGDGIDIKEVRDEMDNIKKERDFLEEKLFSLKNESFGDKDISSLVSKVRTLISDFERIFRESPVHIQKKLIRLFVEKIEVDPDNNSLNYFIRNVPWIDEKLSKRFDFGTVHHKAELYPHIKADRRNAHIASAN